MFTCFVGVGGLLFPLSVSVSILGSELPLLLTGLSWLSWISSDCVADDAPFSSSSRTPASPLSELELLFHFFINSRTLNGLWTMRVSPWVVTIYLLLSHWFIINKTERQIVFVLQDFHSGNLGISLILFKTVAYQMKCQGLKKASLLTIIELIFPKWKFEKEL